MLRIVSSLRVVLDFQSPTVVAKGVGRVAAAFASFASFASFCLRRNERNSFWNSLKGLSYRQLNFATYLHLYIHIYIHTQIYIDIHIYVHIDAPSKSQGVLFSKRYEFMKSITHLIQSNCFTHFTIETFVYCCLQMDYLIDNAMSSIPYNTQIKRKILRKNIARISSLHPR